ncbi:MAG TPA: hypothetical protein VKM56_10760 [Verrucomicrobiae bacterium]|nr:hypothetical protein [Verrucomicrobiae bacterium]
MKTLTAQEAQAQLRELIAEAHRGRLIVLTDEGKEVVLQPRTCVDPETDSPELEAELLKAASGPFTPYSSGEMRGICEQIVRAERSK